DHAQLLAQLLLLLLDAERVGVGPLDGLQLRLHPVQLAVGRGAAHALPEMRGQQAGHRRPEHHRTEGDVLAEARRTPRLLDGNEVDADHLSPGRRVASPTVTASACPLFSIRPRSTLPPTCMTGQGSATSTAPPRR